MRRTCGLIGLALMPALAAAQTNFGAVGVGGSATATVTLKFPEKATASTVAVTTQGAPNLDFTNAGGGSCSTGKSYSEGATCTVKVTFAPKFAGERYGAVVLENGSGVITTAYLQGSGGASQGPKAFFLPGAQSSIGSEWPNPMSVAVDASGNVYVADAGDVSFGGSTPAAVYKETLSGGSYTQSTIGSGFKSPQGVAVDGSGNVYVADWGQGAVFKETLFNGSYTQSSIGSGWVTPNGIAVDGAGNVYVADQDNFEGEGFVHKETLQSDGEYIQSPIGGGFDTPTAIAVDGGGNVYVCDQYVKNVYKETLSGGDYSQGTVGSGWAQPAGIAVDGNGNLLIVDPGADALFLETLSGGQFTQTQIAGAGAAPTAVALDRSGNVYVVDQGAPEIGGVGGSFPLPAVNKFTSALPSTLNFGVTGYGYNPLYTTQTVAVANYGSAALNFSSVNYPVDFPEASGVGTDCTSSTSLPIGSVCTLSIDFSPQQSLGTSSFRVFSENVSVTTNTGNTPGTVDKVSVVGTEEHPSSISITTSANPADQGGPITFTATVTAADGFTLVQPAGTVTIYVDGSVAATPTLSGGVATYTTSALALGNHTAFAVYAGNAVFLGSFSGSVSESVVLGSATATFGDVTIGTVNIGAPSATIPLQITFNTADMLSSIAVLTQGAPNLDFALTGGTCASGTAYAANATCTLDITFTPTAAGTRNGAVVLTGTSGNLAGTGYLQGIGQGAQTTFLPGTQTNIASGFENPSGVAVDGAGNVYVADLLAAAVYKETFSDGTYTQSQIGSGFSCPTGVAVDAAANVYVTDGCTASLYKETLVNGKYIQSTMGNGFGSPFGVAIDGSGNVYVADSKNLAVYKETLLNNGYTQSLVASGFQRPLGVAVDGSGKVYVADYAANAIYKETPFGSGYTQSPVASGFVSPEGVAVDGSGSVYVVEGTDTLVKVPHLITGYVPTPIQVSGAGSPDAIAVDAGGNLYIVDKIAGGNLVFKLDVAAPPALSFAATALGSTSIDSPRTMTVSDIGNEPLSIYAVNYAADFPEASGVASDCKSNTFVTPGGACTLSIDFTPIAVITNGNSQTLSESVKVTTNALNTTATQQDVSVTGTEIKSASYIALASSADPATLGNPVTFTSTVGPANGSSLTPTGTVTFYAGSAVLKTVTLSSGVAAYSTSAMAVGTYAISAVYSGNSSYVSATSNTISESILSDPATGSFGDGSVGSVNIGSSSAPVSLTVTFDTAETLGSIAVLTQGAPNQDFTNAGGGTCATGTAYALAATCTVRVAFAPKYAGTRYGAVVLTGAGGNVVGTGYLQGYGVGPQAAFLPGTLSTLGSGFVSPQGMAVDGNGDVFIADPGSGAVYEESLAGGQFTQSTIGSGFISPSGVAVDGAGNVYVADGDFSKGNGAVYKLAPVNGAFTQSAIGSGFYSPVSVAVDGGGNVYVADAGNGGGLDTAVYKLTLANGEYVQTTIGSGWSQAYDVAVDGSGNVYVADAGADAIYKETLTAGSYTQSQIAADQGIAGIAVDGNANVYVANPGQSKGADGNGTVLKLTPPSGTGTGGYVQTTITAAIPSPEGVAVDGRGNLYVANDAGSDPSAFKLDVGHPQPMTFTNTTEGATSTNSPQTVFVSNLGNSALMFTAVSYPIDFPGSTTATGLCGASAPLAAGASCALTVNFSPVAVIPSGTTQSLNENVSVSSNTLNVAATEEAIAVSGTEIGTGSGRETAPVLFNPPAGSYAVGQLVILADATPATAIYYTTDGTAPTAHSTRYGGPITLNSAETIRALAFTLDLLPSQSTAAAYTVLPGAATPVFSLAPGTYGSGVSVKISDATSGTTIHYTTNGTTPTISSTKYTAAISVSSTETIEAIAVASGHSPSAVASATYSIEASMPVFSRAAGTYNTAQSVKITDSIGGAAIYYTTNGDTPTTSSTRYTAAISVNRTETIKAIAVATGHAQSPVASITYTFQAAKPVLSPAPGTFSTRQTVTISDGTPGAIIYYTTNGNPPTTSSTRYSGGITVTTPETIEAIAVLSGYSQSAVASGTYTISPPATTPAFSPTPGTYSATQSVKISDATSGAIIYYTTNGNTPTTSSSRYTAAIPVSSSETIKAIAVAAGHTQSAVATATYIIVTPAATPVFSPVPGTYKSKQTVTITDATSGATIYYSTNGKAPTTSSTKYIAAITVKSTQTIKAIAVASGHSQSAEASGTYTIK